MCPASCAIVMATPLTRELMASLGLDGSKKEEVLLEDKDLDGCVDEESDEPKHPMHPIARVLKFDVGKYRGKNMTFSQAYVQDKGYVGWCRKHPTAQSVPTMKKFRLYVELRDVRKRDLIQRSGALVTQGPMRAEASPPTHEKEKIVLQKLSKTSRASALS